MADDLLRGEGAGEALPLDIRTELLALWRWRWWALLVLVVAGVAGALAGVVYGKRSYDAETILLYRPDAASAAGLAPLSLSSQRQLVLLRANLEETRDRLGMHASPNALRARCEVWVERETSLMAIRARWSTPEQASRIADTLRDVFVEKERELRKAQMAEAAASLAQGLKVAETQLASAQAALQVFQDEHGVGDVTAELLRRTQERASLEAMRRQTLADQRAADKQLTELQALQAEIKGGGGGDMPLAAADPGEVAARLQVLQSSIARDQAYRTNLSVLAEREVELERAKKLAEEGLVAQQVVDQAQRAYDRQKVVTDVTPAIAEWRKEADLLQRQVLEASAIGSGQPLVRNLVQQAFELQMEKIGLAVKLTYHEERAVELDKEIAGLSPLQRPYEALASRIDAVEKEIADLMPRLAAAQREQESPSALFTVVSPASAPAEASWSSRRPIAKGVTAVTALLGLLIIAGLAVIDRSAKSSRDLAARLRHPALGDLPLIEGETLPPGVSDVAFIERCYVLARQVRHESPDRAARVLVTSASRGEGRTTVALNLAACWGRERQRVLVIDAHVRQDEQQEALRSIITEDERPALGIEAYLAELTSDAASLVCPSVLPGVSVLPCFEALSHPSLLWSPRMEALLDAITPGFDVVVIDAPPLLPNVDTASVARWTDAVILVVRSQGVPMATLHEAVKRLDACGVTLTGAVLNAVRAPFREGR